MTNTITEVLAQLEVSREEVRRERDLNRRLAEDVLRQKKEIGRLHDIAHEFASQLRQLGAVARGIVVTMIESEAEDRSIRERLAAVEAENERLRAKVEVMAMVTLRQTAPRSA